MSAYKINIFEPKPRKGSSISVSISTPGTNEIPGEPVIRDQWKNSTEFLLSCISMSVGVGNILRFPYTVYTNGGGAFFIPYLIVLALIGRPIYFLELALGQFAQYGQVKVWNLSPILGGVGFGSMVGIVCVVSYYASIMGLTEFYGFASLQSTFPWTVCKDEWVGLGVGQIFNRDTNTWSQYLVCNHSDLQNVYLFDNPENKSHTSVAQLYFENEVLKQKNQIDDGIGYPEWRMALCLFLSWIIIWASAIQGVSSSGKVAYFTALYPYVVLVVILIRGLTLDGAYDGIMFFLRPQWEKILEVEVWYAAVNQCFFSLATGFGPIIMYSSYNPFDHNIYRDAWIISAVDTSTSLLAGISIFGLLGHLSAKLNVPIGEILKPGNGLAFISIAEGLSSFNWAYSALFFSMLFTVGVGGATSLVSGIITIICDEYTTVRRWVVTTCVCVALFFVGLIYVTPGGQFMLEMIDHFGANFVIFIMTTLEVIGVAWVYGLNSFILDIEFMLKIKIGWYWKFCWGFFTPVSLTAIFIYALATEKRWTYNGWDYPDSALACGWMITAIALLFIPLCAVYTISRAKSAGFLAKFREAWKPSPEWGPRNIAIKEKWKAFKAKQS